MAEDDEEARRKRAEELRKAIDAAPGRAPSNPREFTDEQARKAAEEEREHADEEE